MVMMCLKGLADLPNAIGPAPGAAALPPGSRGLEVIGTPENGKERGGDRERERH